jgi:DNA gyrase subunit B
MAKAQRYAAQDIKTLEGIEAVRLRPGMYIGSVDNAGLHHLLLEIISNSIDEYLNGYGTEVKITISKDGKMAQVEDNGRGIPFGMTDKGKEAMIEIITNLHSGGKFGQGGYNVAGGLHGIGVTAVNALSSHFLIQSFRDKQVATAASSRGVVSEYKVEPSNQTSTGTRVTFVPDEEIFGDKGFSIPKVEETVKELSFLTSGLVFYVNGKKFYSEKGLQDMIASRVTDPITKPIFISGETDGFLVEVAFQFEERQTEKIYAFTNNIPNREGGTHVTGFKTAFTNSMNKLARMYNLIDDKAPNLNGDMMRSGLTLAVSIKMNKAPVFQGQTKEKLMTAEARGAVSKVVNDLFEKAIDKKDVKVIVDRALVEQKAEEAAKRSREAAKKMASGGRDMKAIKDLPSKLTDCKDRNGELWILEGDSAAGSAKSCRDPKTQAIMPLRGKVLNTHDKELADIIKNKEVKDIMTALGTGVADQFNIHNLRYGKVIILADADSDGAHINVLILTLFITHLPELIKKGKIYMALPPLYRVKSGKTAKYFYTDEDLETSQFKGEVTRYKGIGEMDSEELWETTMDPVKRTLIQLTTENFEETLQIFQTLMGKSSAARRDFITTNNLLDVTDDFFGEEVYE